MIKTTQRFVHNRPHKLSSCTSGYQVPQSYITHKHILISPSYLGFTKSSRVLHFLSKLVKFDRATIRLAITASKGFAQPVVCKTDIHSITNVFDPRQFCGAGQPPESANPVHLSNGIALPVDLAGKKMTNERKKTAMNKAKHKTFCYMKCTCFLNSEICMFSYFTNYYHQV